MQIAHQAPFTSSDASFARRRVFVLSAALVVAVLLRVSIYNDLVDTPALSLGKNVESDMAFFWGWAGEIERDPLQNKILHPLHSWHREIADQAFRTHPELREEIRNESNGWPDSDPRKALWDQWYGGKRYHQEPFYTYMLAAIRSLGLDDPFWIHLVQMGFGLGTLVLLYRVTDRAFGATAATASLAMGTLCAPLIYYELFLLRASLIAFVTLLLVLLAQRIDAAPTSGRFTVFGFALGLAATLKVSFLLFGGLAVAWFLIRQRRKELLKKGVLFALGCSVALSLVATRNLVVGAPSLGLTSVGAVTFAATNQGGYLPAEGWFVEPEAMSGIMFESGGDFLRTVAATIGTHESFRSWLGLLCEKALQVFHWRELPNNTNLYYDFLHSPVLAWLPVGFGFVAPLAFLGTVVCMRRRFGGFIVTQALLSLAPLIGFYVLSRLRAPFLVALIPLAGVAVAFVWEWLRQKRYGRVGVAVGIIVAVSLFIQRDFSPSIGTDVTRAAMHGVSGRAFEAARVIFYGPEIRQALESGDLERATQLSEGEISTRPGWLDEISSKNVPQNDYETGVVNAFIQVYADAAAVAMRRGDDAEIGRYASRYKELRRAHQISRPK